MALKFEPNLTEEELLNGQKIANDHLPKGRLWEAFNVPETANYAVSAAVGAMIALHLKYIEYLKKELNPYTTEDLISTWEESCGLPDPCTVHFMQTLEQRRAQVIYRLRKTPIVTTKEMENAIKELTGFAVKVVPRRSAQNAFNNAFDGGASFDGAEFSTDKYDRFTFDVFIDYAEEGAFDGDAEFDGVTLFDGKRKPTILECLINKIKPSNTVAVYYYDKNSFQRNR